MTGITTTQPQDGDGERILQARIAYGIAANGVIATSQNTNLQTLVAGPGGAARSNGTLLASAARTATTSSTNVSAGNCSCLILTLNITAASGTGGLKLRYNGIDPVSGNGSVGFFATVNVTTVGQVSMVVGKGVGSLYNAASAGSGANCTIGVPLSSTFRIDVTHGDSSSYTYSLNYELVP